MNRNRELISYRRSKAKETLQDAQIFFEAKRFSSSVNRLYYALFYEVTALLLTKDLSSAKHGGVTVKLSGIAALVCSKCGEIYFQPGGSEKVVEAANSLFKLAAAERQYKRPQTGQICRA